MKKICMLVIALCVTGVFMSCNVRKLQDMSNKSSKESDKPQPVSEKQAESQPASEKQAENQPASEKQAAPEQQAPKKPEFFVIDTYKARGHLEDNVRLYNRTTRANISFNVYLQDPRDNNRWKLYGTGFLKGPGDTEFIKSRMSGDLEDYRFFAIQAQDTRDYRYDFEKKHNDLYIYIYDK